MSESRPYRKPFMTAIGVHVVIILLLFVGLPVTTLTLSDSKPGMDEAKPIIDAVMIDQSALNKEVSRLAEQDAAQKAIEAKRIKDLKQLEAQVAQKRQQEELRLKALKEEQQALKEKAAEKLKAEQIELAKLKKAKEQALLVKQDAERKAKEAEKQKQALEEKAKEAERLKQAADKLAKAQQEEAAKLAKAQAAAKQKQAAAEAAAQNQIMQDQISQYASMMMRKVTQNWRRPLGIESSALSCVIAVKLLPTGEVLEAIVVESSGQTEFDRSTELAVLKSSPLPMPSDDKARAEFRHFTFRFKPEIG